MLQVPACGSVKTLFSLCRRRVVCHMLVEVSDEMYPSQLSDVDMSWVRVPMI